MVLQKTDNNINNKNQINFDFIELKNVKYSIPESNRTIFDNVNLIIKKNEITGIKGESGVGKAL